MKSLGLALLAGLVAALGFAPLGFWPLTLVAFACMIQLVETAPSLRAALARGWWFGVGQFVLGLNWIATAFTYQAAMPAWLGWVGVVLLSLYLACYPAMAAGLAWRWAGRGAGRPACLVLILAAAWIVTEWLRATLFTGFAWNPIGIVLIDDWAKWLAPLIGTYGLSGIVLLAAGLLWLAARHRRRLVLLPILLLAFAATDLRLTGPAPAAPDGGPLLRIVQPNLPQQQRWDPDQVRGGFLRMLRMTGRPDDRPRLILWPEAAVPYDLHDGEVTAALAQVIGPHDLLLTGGVTPADAPPGVPLAEYNSLFAIGPGGHVLGRYDKAHLVPYGEYLPLRQLTTALGLSRLVPGDGDILSGPGPGTLDLPGFGRVGGQICYEIVFSGEIVDRDHRPDFVFNPSNDAWFGAWGPPQQLAQARLRAIEEGLPVLRATPTGISAIIRPDGIVAQSLALGEAGLIDGRLPAALPPTLFALYGNLLPFGFALLLVAAAIAVRRKAR